MREQQLIDKETVDTYIKIATQDTYSLYKNKIYLCAKHDRFYYFYNKVYLEDNKIVNTECECPRGSYKCSHAAALFIHGIHNLSRTDIECSWKKQKVPVVVKSISEMYPPPTNYNPLEKEVEQAKAVFYKDLKAYSQFTGLGWILSPEPKRDFAN